MNLIQILAAGADFCATPSVDDGDTIRCGAERIRIANIDAPELPDSPKCADYRKAYLVRLQVWLCRAECAAAVSGIGHARIERLGKISTGARWLESL